MRNRLTVARGFVHLLRTGKAKDDPELTDQYMGFIDESLENASELLEKREEELREEDR